MYTSTMYCVQNQRKKSKKNIYLLFKAPRYASIPFEIAQLRYIQIQGEHKDIQKSLISLQIKNNSVHKLFLEVITCKINVFHISIDTWPNKAGIIGCTWYGKFVLSFT